MADHKATTLSQVLGVTQKSIGDPVNQSPKYRLSLVGGNAGNDAATNIVIQQANRNMLLLVYLVVIIFCNIAFRSWQAVIFAVPALMITPLLAQAVMIWLHIGIKVATLPVIALGAGIGVHYAPYVLSVILPHLRNGATWSEAYYRTLLFTGRVVNRHHARDLRCDLDIRADQIPGRYRAFALLHVSLEHGWGHGFPAGAGAFFAAAENCAATSAFRSLRLVTMLAVG